MGDHNYYTALSHAVLAGTSIYCLMHHMTDMGIICYGFVASTAVVGLWRWGNPDAGYNSRSLYEKLGVCAETLALGAVTAEMWTSSRILPEFWWLQIGLPVIPVALYALEKQYKDPQKCVLIFNGISILYVSITTQNWWALAAAISYLWGYLYVKDQGSFGSMPSIDLINYELCFFCYFALRALGS